MSKQQTKKQKKGINIAGFEAVLKIVQKSARSKSRKNKFFDYGTWYEDWGNHKTVADVIKHPCNTFGCLAGWGALIGASETKAGQKLCPYDLWYEEEARKFYRIDEDEGRYLFRAVWHRANYRAPVEDVIAKLKNIIKTGQIINPEFDDQY